MKTLEELQEIALKFEIDISNCQDIECIEKKIEEEVSYLIEKIRNDYKEEIEKEKIEKNEYQKRSVENLINLIKEEEQNKLLKDR